MGKKKKKRKAKTKRRTVDISPIFLLRPQLDQFLNSKIASESSTKQQLDSLFHGVEGYEALPVFIKAYIGCPPFMREHIDKIIPQWLTSHNYQKELTQLFKAGDLDTQSETVVVAWLKQCDIDTSCLQKIAKKIDFYKCYEVKNDFQGMLMVFWHIKNRDKVRGMSFLLDFHPPWDGAVKDIMNMPQRSPKEAEIKFVDSWEDRGMRPEQISKAQAKKKILQALEMNLEQQIRIPPDLINARDVFLEYILALPDTETTSVFTAKDFDELTKLQRSPEKLRNFEQNVGGFTRLPDGDKIFIGNFPDDFD